MNVDDFVTIYCKSWELKAIKKELIRDKYQIISIEHITKGKVVIVARDRFRNESRAH